MIQTLVTKATKDDLQISNQVLLPWFPSDGMAKQVWQRHGYEELHGNSFQCRKICGEQKIRKGQVGQW
jgi:hypothetical protein